MTYRPSPSEAPTASADVLIIGCGYVGQRLIAQLADQHPVIAVVRSPAHAEGLQRRGIRTLRLDLDHPDSSTPALPPARAVAYLAPPPNTGSEDPRLDHCLSLLATVPEIFMYMSTTGVYGDVGGATVNEATPLHPLTERARRRVSAEQRVQTWSQVNGNRTVILRVPGIYGPGRLPLERLRQGEPALRREDAPIGNRIHVDDLAAACRQALLTPGAHGVYNVCDGHPLAPADFLDAVADQAGLARVPKLTIGQARQQFTPQRLSFLEEHRLIDAGKIRRELGWHPRYTDPLAGIRASLGARCNAAPQVG